MQPTDRPEFVKLAEALFAAFDRPPSDGRMQAYWLGLQRMNLHQFEAAVSHVIGPDGEDELPTPKQLFAISRKLRNAQRAAELAARQSAPVANQPEPDRFQAYANRVMVAMLCSLAAQHGSAASDKSLAEMTQVAHRYADAYREMCVEEPKACEEMRDAMREPLTRAFVPREPRPEFQQRLSTPAVGDTWAAVMAQLAKSNAIGGQNAPPDSPQWNVL